MQKLGVVGGLLILLVGVYLVLFVWLPIPWLQVTPLGQFEMWGAASNGESFFVIGVLSCFFVVLGLIVMILGFVIKSKPKQNGN